MFNFRAQGKLTIRLLLDVNETCLRSQGFFDLWKQQKKYENEVALARLRERLIEIDSIHDIRQRWITLCHGVLAGNLLQLLLLNKIIWWGDMAVPPDCP